MEGSYSSSDIVTRRFRMIFFSLLSHVTHVKGRQVKEGKRLYTGVTANANGTGTGSSRIAGSAVVVLSMLESPRWTTTV